MEKSAFTLRTMQKVAKSTLSRTQISPKIEQWTLHTLDERRTGDITEATSQTFQLAGWCQGVITLADMFLH